jgi:hypothetical protein
MAMARQLVKIEHGKMHIEQDGSTTKLLDQPMEQTVLDLVLGRFTLKVG